MSGTYHDCAHKNNTPKCYPGHNHQPLVVFIPAPITVLDRSQVLMALNEGGMQYLIAGARANVGLKGGRHMFEAPVRIIAAWDMAVAVADVYQLILCILSYTHMLANCGQIKAYG